MLVTFQHHCCWTFVFVYLFVLFCLVFVLFVCLLACLVVCLFVCFCLLDMTVTLHSTAQYTESTALPNYGLAQVALGTQLTL